MFKKCVLVAMGSNIFSMDIGAEIWEDIYSIGLHQNRWPWSDVISLFSRYQRGFDKNKGIQPRVLELGCGTGPNIPFLESCGFEYFGVEFSKSAYNFLLSRFPHLHERVQLASMDDASWSQGYFHYVLDKSALTHCSTKIITQTIRNMKSSMVPGGIFVGVDWFSTNHSDYESNCDVIDDFSRQSFQSGQFVDLGLVHFFTESHLRELFEGFTFLHLSEKVITDGLTGKQFASFNFVAQMEG